jgi:hypothetical protein
MLVSWNSLVRACVYTCMYVCTHTHARACACALTKPQHVKGVNYLYACVSAHMRKCEIVHKTIFVCVCVYVCVCALTRKFTHMIGCV